MALRVPAHVQSVERLSMGWTTEGRSSSSGRIMNCSFSTACTGSEAHPANYTMGSEGAFPGVNAAAE
jgi:hypothetical protein